MTDQEYEQASQLLRHGVGPRGEIPIAVGPCQAETCDQWHLAAESYLRLADFGLRGAAERLCIAARFQLNRRKSDDDIAIFSVNGTVFGVGHARALLAWPLKIPVSE